MEPAILSGLSNIMDVGNLNDWDLSQVVSGKEVIDLINSEFPLEPVDANYQGEVASQVPVFRRFRRDRGDYLSHAAILRRLHPRTIDN